MRVYRRRHVTTVQVAILFAIIALVAACAPPPAAVQQVPAASPTPVTAAPTAAAASEPTLAPPTATSVPPTATAVAAAATATSAPPAVTAEPSPTTAASGDTGSAGEGEALAAEDKDGLPVPVDYTGYSGEQSPFRRGLAATSPSPLPAVLKLYRAELSARQWTEQPAAVAPTDEAATLAFTHPEQGQMTLELTRNTDGGTDIALTVRDEAAATAAGAIPPSGKARIYFANPTEAEVTFSIAGQDVKVAVGKPDDTMADATRIDVTPGNLAFTLTQPGADPAKDEVRVAEGEVWILVAGPGGALAIQAY